MSLLGVQLERVASLIHRPLVIMFSCHLNTLLCVVGRCLAARRVLGPFLYLVPLGMSCLDFIQWIAKFINE